MKTSQWILPSVFFVLAQTASANSNVECDVTGISGLWPDGVGGWYGSSKMEWRDCADGNSYVATCTHQGSGDTMGSCVCQVNDSVEYEKSCLGLVSSSDLGEASRQCCGYF